MTMTWKQRLLRLTGGATAGALLAMALGQISQAMNGNCTVLCQPDVAGVLGGFVGVVAFWNVGRE